MFEKLRSYGIRPPSDPAEQTHMLAHIHAEEQRGFRVVACTCCLGHGSHDGGSECRRCDGRGWMAE